MALLLRDVGLALGNMVFDCTGKELGKHGKMLGLVFCNAVQALADHDMAWNNTALGKA